MTENNTLDESRLKILLQVMLFVALLSASIITVFHTDIRLNLKSFFSGPSRTVLSVVIGDVMGNGTAAKVVKVQTKDSLLIEIYDAPENGARKLLHTLKIQDPHDGYFHLNGSATNLALEDIDNDGVVDIIAPSFDANMVAHLNVYKYDPQLETFVPITSADTPLNDSAVVQ
ncbi:MAG: hypothetical protein KDD61_06855 [Bdellovibrionales bacterium]|nr:hypothetical protein [Bdellovibrionales bacterium]